jgi:hypothetical protein
MRTKTQVNEMLIALKAKKDYQMAIARQRKQKQMFLNEINRTDLN